MTINRLDSVDYRDNAANDLFIKVDEVYTFARSLWPPKIDLNVYRSTR